MFGVLTRPHVPIVVHCYTVESQCRGREDGLVLRPKMEQTKAAIRPSTSEQRSVYYICVRLNGSKTNKHIDAVGWNTCSLWFHVNRACAADADDREREPY